MKTINNQQSIINKGFSLIEMLVYIAVLALLLVIIIGILISMLSSQKEINASKAIESSAISALERITREIRESDSALASGSTLTLAKDEEVIIFSVNADGILEVSENGNIGPLTREDTEVSSLSFTSLSDETVNAVRIVMEITSGLGEYQKTGTFYNTVVLR